MSGGTPDRSKKVMVISPHPDDIDFGCSGTMAKWSREGSVITYVICTSGDKGSDDPEISGEILSKMREEEQRAAAKMVGVSEVVFLRLKDGDVENNHEFRELLVKLIRMHRPEIVLGMDPANTLFDNPYVSHRDHRETALAVFDAVYPAARNRNYFPSQLTEGLMPHSVNEIYFFATPFPNTWIDITETIDTKIAALKCHKSQMIDFEDVANRIRQWGAEAGKEKGFAYAEAFRHLAFPR